MTTVRQEWYVDGWHIGIDQGRKGPGDKRIWVAVAGGEYNLMSLPALGAVVRLWYDNEERLYPRSQGFKGGDYMLAFLRSCCEVGVRAACRLYHLDERAIYRIPSDARAPFPGEKVRGVAA